MAWPLIKYLPERTNLRFVRLAPLAALLSLTGVLGSLALILAPLAQGKGVGFNLGIDFKGGILLDLRSPEPIELDRLRARIGELGLGDFQLQDYGTATEVQLRFETPERGEPAAAVGAVQTAARELIPGVEFQRVEVVGPQVSGELLWSGVAALGTAIGLMLLYIWFRFEWQFGLGAVIALLHDVILTMGLFAVLKLEFTLTVVAALLTIIGYSINDTVVIFDRLRENLRKFKKMPLKDVIDLSVNETLSRTIMTGLTTLMALGAMLYLGGEALFGFTLALFFGVIVGTYSSVYVAAPVILLWGVKRGAERAEHAEAEAGAG